MTKGSANLYYFSKKLTDVQRKYCTIDKEALALVLSVRAFRVYMGGHVIAYSDHDPLRFMEKMAEASQRLFRWCTKVKPIILKFAMCLEKIILLQISQAVQLNLPMWRRKKYPHH